jgi:hypothetical protein
MIYDIKGVNIPHVGYGRMVDEFSRHLARRAELSDDAGTVVFGMLPDMVKGWWADQSTAVMTMWETDRLPARFERFCHLFDRVIVPCDWNKELFDSIHDDVHVVPLGVNHDVWSPQNVPDNNRFRFLTGGSGWLRKGIPQVIQAFKDANLPDSELVIKIPPYTFDDPQIYDFEDRITVIKDALDPIAERDLHATADCFVSASRGEGFGLMPLQQCALGNRVIGTAAHGHLMFSHLFDFPLSARKEKSFSSHYHGVGNWFVPDHDELVDSMRHAYKLGRPALWERQSRFEDTLSFSWDNAVDRLLDVHPPSGRVSREKWVETGSRMVPVEATKTLVADIGRYRVRLTAGETTWVPLSTLDNLLESEAVIEK